MVYGQPLKKNSRMEAKNVMNKDYALNSAPQGTATQFSVRHRSCSKVVVLKELVEISSNCCVIFFGGVHCLQTLVAF